MNDYERGYDDGFYHGYSKSIYDAVDTHSLWIKVSEKKPPEDKKIITQHTDGTILVQ